MAAERYEGTNGEVGIPGNQDHIVKPRTADFYTVLSGRPARHHLQINGTRKDWISEYPELRTWKTNVTVQILHREITLALHVALYHGACRYIIGVSKNPCAICDKFFEHWNNITHNNSEFIIAPGHRKVYANWQLTGIGPLDSQIISDVWASVDSLIQETEHNHRGDTIIPLYR
jgi:hypothetical protein